MDSKILLRNTHQPTKILDIVDELVAVIQAITPRCNACLQIVKKHMSSVFLSSFLRCGEFSLSLQSG